MPSVLIRVIRPPGRWLRRLVLLIAPGGAGDPVRSSPPTGGLVRPLIYGLVLIGAALCLVLAGPAIHVLRLAGAAPPWQQGARPAECR